MTNQQNYHRDTLEEAQALMGEIFAELKCGCEEDARRAAAEQE